MTAEVILVNRSAIALAADSAVTIGRDKVWKFGHKLFSAGPHNDIGIMIYNSGDFRGISWEIIIKEFRREIATREFQTVDEFSADFITFVDRIRHRPNSAADLNFSLIFVSFLEAVQTIAKSKVDKSRAKQIEFALKVQDILIKDRSKIPSFPISSEDFATRFRPAVLSLARDIFAYKIGKVLSDLLMRVAYEHVSRQYTSDYSTGIVIAGYGRKELFPSVVHMTVDGEDGAYLRSWIIKGRNMNDPKFKQSSYIVPFAQADMMFLFMEGTAQSHIVYLHRLLSNVLQKKSDELIKSFVVDTDAAKVEKIRQRSDNQKIVEGFLSEFSKHRRSTLVSPVLTRLRTLPKEEMAAVAEAMVEITALRRKVSSSLETVGGPVDVAVISKGDGFIWIKRKKYFDIDANADFGYRRALSWERGDEQATNQARDRTRRERAGEVKPRTSGSGFDSGTGGDSSD